MSAMIEVYYKPPSDSKREKAVEAQVAARGGKLTCREEDVSRITLTVEFDDRNAAEAMMIELTAAGMYVEGPSDY